MRRGAPAVEGQRLRPRRRIGAPARPRSSKDGVDPLADTLREISLDEAQVHDIVRRQIGQDQQRFVAREPGATAPYDGLAEVWFASREACQTRMATTAGRTAARRVRDDERRFVDVARSPRWWGVEVRVL